ncbi:O-antigen ligase family protein [Halorhodospira halophila]|uniref:O-antigen ligase family protein n=1 Tax=Halorhodospira halophila TaxID=1053 RepID=UPI001912F6CC|nr:O-antigen ligase family protein [Halorhodospira halophila]
MSNRFSIIVLAIIFLPALGVIPYGGMRLVDAMILFSSLLFFGVTATTARLHLKSRDLAVTFFLIAAIAIFSFFPLVDPSTQSIAALYFLRGALIVLVMCALYHFTHNTILMKGWATLTSLFIFFAIIDYLHHAYLGSSPFGLSGIYGRSEGTILRLDGFMNPNYLSHWVAITSIAILAFITDNTPPRKDRLLLWTTFFIISLGAILTNSRTAQFALVVSILFLILHHSLQSKITKNISTVAFFAAPVFIGLALSPTLYFIAISDSIPYLAADRFFRSSESLSFFLNLPLSDMLFGVGGNIYLQMDDGMSIHNGYYQLLVDHGIIGLSLFLLCVYYIIYRSITRHGRLRPEVFALFSSLMYAAANDTFITAHFWLIFGLLVATTVTTSKDERQHQKSKPITTVSPPTKSGSSNTPLIRTMI